MTTIETDHKTFVCAENGGEPYIEGKVTGLGVANRTHAGAWETFEVVRSEDGDNTLGLKSANGFFGCFENEGKDGVFVFNRPSLGAWEKIVVHALPDGRVGLEAACRPGWFLTAEPDGRLSVRQPMFDGQPSMTPGGWESFVVQFSNTAITSGRRPDGHVYQKNRGFHDAAGPFLAVTATHMDAINLVATDPDRFRDNIDYIASMGMSQRVLGILGWQGDERVDPRHPDYWSWLAYVIDYAFENGIRTQFTVFADLFFIPELQSQSGRLRHCDKVVEFLRLRREKLLAIEGCNEPGNSDLWSRYGTASDLVEVTRKIGQALDVPYAAGALYGGPHSTTAWHLAEDHISEEARTLLEGCPAVSMHLDRGLGSSEGLWRSIRQPWEGRSTARMGKHNQAWWNNEPIGHDSSVEWFNNPHSLRVTPMQPSDLDLHRIHAMSTFMSGAALHNWHTEGGTGYSSDRLIRHEHGAKEAMAALDVLPSDLPSYDFHNWHWPSNPVVTVEGCVYDRNMRGRGTLRTIAATKDNNVLIFPFCILEGATLRARHAMKLSKFESVDGTYQKTGELDLSAGESWDQPRALDALYVGKFV